MTEVWARSKRIPNHLAATVASDRAKHVAQALNRQGFKVKLKAVTNA